MNETLESIAAEMRLKNYREPEPAGNAKWNSNERMPWPADYFEIEPPHAGCAIAFLDGEEPYNRGRRITSHHATE